MELRNDFISSRTNVERNSGFTGEKGERERGGRLHRAFLHVHTHTYMCTHTHTHTIIHMLISGP